LEYIQCTHCSKKYGVNDKIRAAVGRDTPCKACHETFSIVLHGGEVLAEDLSVVREGGWDPSFTMPSTEVQSVSSKKDEGSSQAGEGEEGELAAFIKAKKNKKQQQIWMTAGLAVSALLGLAIFFFLGGEPDLVTQVSNITHSAEKKAQQTLPSKLEDKDKPECRQAAAAQWVLDARVMHGSYDAEEYIALLKRSQLQTAQVRMLCSDTQVIQHILKSATEEYKPLWFEAELKALLP